MVLEPVAEVDVGAAVGAAVGEDSVAAVRASGMQRAVSRCVRRIDRSSQGRRYRSDTEWTPGEVGVDEPVLPRAKRLRTPRIVSMGRQLSSPAEQVTLA